jgi:hypothetical protein
VSSGEEPRINPKLHDLATGRPWPLTPQSIVRAWDDESGYTIDLELRLGTNDQPVVTGIAVRRALPMEPRQRDITGGPRWPEATEPVPVSPRDLKRLPLSSLAKAAKAWIESMKLEPGSEERDAVTAGVVRTLHPPRGWKAGARVTDELYEFILKALEHHERNMEPHPVLRIAEALGEPPAKVHVWVHRAKARQKRGRDLA